MEGCDAEKLMPSRVLCVRGVGAWGGQEPEEVWGGCPTGTQKGPWIRVFFQNLVILKSCSHLYDSPPQPVFVSGNGLLDEPC